MGRTSGIKKAQRRCKTKLEESLFSGERRPRHRECCYDRKDVMDDQVVGELCQQNIADVKHISADKMYDTNIVYSN
ncbi:hypothetical protein [Aliivibrio finisterrensis]|uniref:Uncharacterized protein n=1 Tax=Aliivibrio finisterrensis TaxID=511998 RepID=A0A6N6RQ61_9GAMM|nr:hypothetical protein [Aliivibrio finisterrensis]KAB2823673.1 hypothetical protein F8B77_14240 [Aliivibrio finisterrensis]